LGFPGKRNEEWKYTNIAPILDSSFKLPASGFTLTRKDVLARLKMGEDICLVVLENGKLNTEISDQQLPDGLVITTLAKAKSNAVVQAHFSKYADMQSDAFAALNTAFFTEGLLVAAAPGSHIEKPVIIAEISQGQESVICHNRLLVVAGKNSSLKTGYISVSGNESVQTFTNAVNEIAVEENGSLEFDLFQNENTHAFQVCNTFVSQHANSRFTINTISMGGNIVRNKLHIALEAENCETHLYGLYIASENQLIDNHTAVAHRKPHSQSNQLYKGIIGGKAHGVFNGKIMVEKDAQKTNAYQSNKNILLGNDAVINAKPQLEIFADDVKCTHGATTGQMDDEALFYLRSRGINEMQAKAMLNKAFASDILNNVTIGSLHGLLADALEDKLIRAHAHE
jgi:Fe-S cluster assembly protein SufD